MPIEKWRTLAVNAADALFDSPGSDPGYEPENRAAAAAAVERFGERLLALPGVVNEVVDGARAGARTLSGDPLQGLSEIIQNADDAGASRVRFLLQEDGLLVSHNGRGVVLRDVLALALPWLTTKRSDSAATGRFGIGLMTLHALTDTLEVFSGSYSVRLGDPAVAPIDPISVPDRFADGNDTVIRLPLVPGALSSERLLEWVARWDDPALLFCRHVTEVAVTAGGVARTLGLNWSDVQVVEAEVGGELLEVPLRTATARDGRTWLVAIAEAAPPVGLKREGKAIGVTTPLGVALPLHTGDSGKVYAGLPLVSSRHPVRVNAQFDPIASRQDLADTEWNAALIPLLADLWTSAVLELFDRGEAEGWHVIPLEGPSAEAVGAVAALEAQLLDHARNVLPAVLRFTIGGAKVPVAELAVESAELEGILTQSEIARVAGMDFALPPGARDTPARWRDVLDDWRQAGATLSKLVTTEDALILFDDDSRSCSATLALAAVAIRFGLGGALAGRRCIVKANDSRMHPPLPSDAWVFVTKPGGLAEVLGMGHVLHPRYLADNDDGRTVRSWLQAQDAIGDADESRSILSRLAAAGRADRVLPEVLSDEQIRAVRDAFESLNPDEQKALGPDVGRAITLRGYYFDARRRRKDTAARPCEVYLPKAVDREPDGFAVAAAETPGLVWLHGTYAQVLRSQLGRSGLGALRFLRLLGAETAPRVAPHPRLEAKYSDQRRGLPTWVAGNPPGRVEALQRIGASYSLEDRVSDDLAAVLTDIGQDKRAIRRRARANAVLATLGRAWADRFEDYATVTAAGAYYGWQSKGAVKAFWLWQAATIPWLDDGNAVPSPPIALRLRTQGTVAVHGSNAAEYIHRDIRADRLDVLAELGVSGEPSTGDLLERLRVLRDAPSEGVAVEADIAVIYQALADRLTSRRHVHGDLGTSELRRAFSVAPGLVRTNLGWRRPSEVLAGEPVFGNRRAFAPHVPGSEALWTRLQIRRPALHDCLDVLNDLAKAGDEPDAATEIILIESLRLLSRLLGDEGQPTRVRRRLNRLGLWTTLGWVTDRPVYAIEDPVLAQGLSNRVPVWRPGGELAQFRHLLDPLGLTEISPGDAKVVGVDAATPDEEATELLRVAVPLLREDLARNDPATERALQIAWNDLESFVILIVDELRVRVSGLASGRTILVPVAAKAVADAKVIYLTDPDLLGRVDGGGRALACLFAADPRRVAQAWIAACDAARTGREARRLELAAEKAAEEEHRNALDIESRLRQFSNEKAVAHARAAERGKASSTHMASETVPSPASPSKSAATQSQRRLVDPSTLRVVDPRGRIVGPAATKSSNRQLGPTLESNGLARPRSGGAVPNDVSAVRGYSDLAKETVGLELLRKVLASESEDMTDLRAQRNVGADAIDDLARYFELKVFAGAEPDYVTLEESQIRRAMSTPDFFLVVVSGVETGKPTVRVIVDPLDQLEIAATSSVRFTGVKASHSLVYELEAEGEVGNGEL